MSLSLLRISRALARSDEKTFAKLWPKVRHNNMWVTSLWQKIFKEEKSVSRHFKTHGKQFKY